jgi:hypothetical protein
MRVHIQKDAAGRYTVMSRATEGVVTADELKSLAAQYAEAEFGRGWDAICVCVTLGAGKPPETLVVVRGESQDF